MQTPKMMATRITRYNYDVVAAIAPGLVSRYDNTNEIYGEFIVINEPQFVSHEYGPSGIELVHTVISEEEFEGRFTFTKKDNPFGKGFIPVRHKTPRMEEPVVFPAVVRRIPPTPKPKRYSRR